MSRRLGTAVLADGNWWLFYKGGSSYIATGYYPKSVYGSGQMSKNATQITYGGECTGKPSGKQIGSGGKASQGWGKSAFQNTIFYIPRNEDNGVGLRN